MTQNRKRIRATKKERAYYEAHKLRWPHLTLRETVLMLRAPYKGNPFIRMIDDKNLYTGYDLLESIGSKMS